MPARDIILIGASLGGIEALSELVPQFPADFAAAIFVVQHTSPESRALLSEILDRRGPLSAVVAADGMAIEAGYIYVAPPDRHLLLSGSGVRVVYGPRENRTRPAIDPLFRTAAANYRSRVIGVILSGLQSDGALGLHAVKRCGGLAVVQDPESATCPDMPQHALAAVDVDHVVALAEMGPLLCRLVAEQAPTPPDIPEDIQLEARLTEEAMHSEEWQKMPGRATAFVCPECGGGLKEVEEAPVRRFRCHVGHGYIEQTLLEEKDRAVEDAFWIALRTLQEQAFMLNTMAREEQERGRSRSATSYAKRAQESEMHALRLQEFLAKIM